MLYDCVLESSWWRRGKADLEKIFQAVNELHASLKSRLGDTRWGLNFISRLKYTPNLLMAGWLLTRIKIIAMRPPPPLSIIR